ncbi:ABC-type Fe3+ transport system permease subunit [Bacillus tianshenii]|uniref:ABC-type Fe3+ transport system permease subunit n=1 Tax=Sutcliffiella tianshenii TaxID=1463404 RepID=A0ABS2NZU8_9BACI|nr:hypothetical protein [Bacillus tianshenii]MBM7620003.1 ABC-type Fe3+ transport system permease subunit [Bacillus tianshenii]
MKLFMILSQLFYVVGLVFWLPIWGMSFMAFDQGIAFWNTLFVLTISAYPLAVIICSILAWVLHNKKRRAAVIINLIPMLWVVGAGMLVLL